MTEYRTLTVPIDNNKRVVVGGVNVMNRPEIDAVMNAMAGDGWTLARFAMLGNMAWLVFRRETEEPQE